jgi:integrase
MARRKQRANGRGTLVRRKSDGPWYAIFHDENGKRVWRCAETTSKEAAREFLERAVKEVASFRRELASNPAGALAARAGRLPLARHLADYLRWCRRHLAPRNVELKRLHLRRLADDLGASSPLAAFQLEAIDRSIASRGGAARTINSYRQTLHAFAEFLIDRERMTKNPVARIEKRNEAADRRRVRRAFTEDELRRFLGVAQRRQGAGSVKWSPRGIVYLVAVRTALRRGELTALTWGDLDLERSTLRVRAAVSKNRREASLHLHPEVVEALRAIRPAAVLPMARVFPSMPTAKTFNSDLERAKIAKQDEQGRVLDFHALRTTAATTLCERTTPAIAQQALRHAKYETTQRHYVSLADDAVAKAIDSLPRLLGEPGDSLERAVATGTHGAAQQCSQQSVWRSAAQEGAAGRGSAQDGGGDPGSTGNAGNLVDASGSAVPRGSLRLAAGGEVVGDEGLEPSTPSLSSWCSSQLS